MAIDLIKFRDFAYLKNGEVKKEGDDGWKDGNCGDGTLYVVGYKDEGLGGSDPEFRIELNDIGDIHNLLDVTIDTNNRLYLTFDGQPFGIGYKIPTSGGDGDFDVSKLHFYFDNGTDPDFGKRFYLKYGDVTVTDPISFDAKMNDDGQHLDFYIGGALTKSVLLPAGSQSGVTSVVRRAGDVQVKTVAEVFNELYPDHNIDDYKGQVLTTKTKLLVNGVEDPYLIPTYLPIPADDTPGGDSGETEVVVIQPAIKNVIVTDHSEKGYESNGEFQRVVGIDNAYNLILNIATQVGPQGAPGVPGSDANIDVRKGTIETGDKADITITDEIVEGVKTYFINAVLPQAGESVIITPDLRNVEVNTIEEGEASGRFVRVSEDGHTYDLELTIPVVKGDPGTGIFNITYDEQTSTSAYRKYKINYTDGKEPDEFTVYNGEDGDEGNGIRNIEKILHTDAYDTYRINFTKLAQPYEFTVYNGAKGDPGDDASIVVEKGEIRTGAQGDINVTESEVGGVKTYTIDAVFPENGGTTIVNPLLRNVNVETNEADVAEGEFKPVENTDNEYDLHLNLPVVKGEDGNSITNVDRIYEGDEYSTYRISFSKTEPYEFNVYNGTKGDPGNPGSDANIDVKKGSITTGETADIEITDEIVGGVKTYFINATLPQAGESITITPSLRYVNVTTNEEGVATGNFVPVENTENVYDVNFNLPVVNGEDGNSITNFERIYQDDEYSTYKISFSKTEPYEFNVYNGQHGIQGPDGKSAYEIAISTGSFVGTEEEWIDSLKGRSIEDVQLHEGTYDESSSAENVWDCLDVNGDVVGSFKTTNGAEGQRGQSINDVHIHDGSSYSDESGATNTYDVEVENGTVVGSFNVTNGNDGKSIESVELEDGAEYDSMSGASNTYECKDSDGNVVGTFTVNNGAQGESITGPRGFSIDKVKIEEGAEYDEGPGANNTYEVLTEDGNVVGTFTTTNGLDGRGIQSVTLTQTSGKVKTYTITFTDNTAFKFNVTDGNDGINGNDGTIFSLYRIQTLLINNDPQSGHHQAADYDSSGVEYWQYSNELFESVEKWDAANKQFENSSIDNMLDEIMAESCVVDVFPDTENPMHVAVNMLYGAFATFNPLDVDPSNPFYPHQGGNGFKFCSIRELPMGVESTSKIYFTVKVYSNIK